MVIVWELFAGSRTSKLNHVPGMEWLSLTLIFRSGVSSDDVPEMSFLLPLGTYPSTP